MSSLTHKVTEHNRTYFYPYEGSVHAAAVVYHDMGAVYYPKSGPCCSNSITRRNAELILEACDYAEEVTRKGLAS